MSDYLGEIRTVVTGVCSGPEAEIRQGALSILRDRLLTDATNRRNRFLDLVPEPENPYDSDAIKVMADIPELGGRVQLGYVKNSQTRCLTCEVYLERFPPNRVCPKCGTTGKLERVGIATKLAKYMREQPGERWYCVILDITGGVGAKENLGCNIKIARMIKKGEAPKTGTPIPQEPKAPAGKSGATLDNPPRKYDFDE